MTVVIAGSISIKRLTKAVTDRRDDPSPCIASISHGTIWERGR